MPLACRTCHVGDHQKMNAGRLLEDHRKLYHKPRTSPVGRRSHPKDLMSGAPFLASLARSGALLGIGTEGPESHFMRPISRISTAGYLPCSSKNFSTSMAAMHPVPA